MFIPAIRAIFVTVLWLPFIRDKARNFTNNMGLNQ
jgi:hypothetical protein